MRIRSLAVLAVAAAAVVPATAHAGNPEDCISPISLRSGQGLIANGQVANCDGLQANELTYSPVLPGGAADVLLEGVALPINGDRRTQTGSYLRYTSTAATGATSVVTVWLTWQQGEGLQGPIEGTWGSQAINFGPRDSVLAGDIEVVVIDNIPDEIAGTPTTTYTRTFKTLTGWADGV